MSGLASLKGEIKTDDQTRRAFSRDASLFSVTPMGVISPKDKDDLKVLINMATKLAVQGRPISLTARDAGTCMSGGSLTEGWVLDMQTHFNTIGAFDRYHKRLKVQGGVLQREIEKVIYPKALYFAPYPSSHDICGIGGMIGNNASGEKSLQHGPTSANIDRLKVVLSDGNEYEFGPLTQSELDAKLKLTGFEGDLYRGVTKVLDDNKHLIATHHPKTVKNAAGYALWELWNPDRTVFNLARLFIGSQGTLGITTEAELNLTSVPKYSRMIVTPIDDIHGLTPVVQKVLTYKPAAVETFDHFTYDFAKQSYPADAKRAALAEGKHLVVLSVFEHDDKHELDRISNAVWADLTQSGFDTYAIDDPNVIASFLLIRQKSFAMLFDHPHGALTAAPFLEDSIVPLEHYGDFLLALEAILKGYDMTYTYAGHIGQGSIRLIPLVDMSRTDTPARIMELEGRLSDLVLKYHGSISVDHNDGLIRTPFLQKQYGDHMIALFEQIKNLFDPFHIFNPCKKVGGSIDYSIKHLAS
jgi:FAD/FMN-containing dehydrogenase